MLQMLFGGIKVASIDALALLRYMTVFLRHSSELIHVDSVWSLFSLLPSMAIEEENMAIAHDSHKCDSFSLRKRH